MPTTVTERLAGAALAAESLALLVVVGWQVVAIVGGDTGDLVSAIALVVLTVIGAGAVLAFAVAVWRDLSWGRSGGIVVQLLILAVALGAATGQFAHGAIAAGIAVPGLVGFMLLVLAARAAAARR